MVILFEIFIKDENLMKTITPEEGIVLDDIYIYVEERLMPLKDEIEAEELNEIGCELMATIIHLPTGLSFHNYSKKLRDKMEACFSNVDKDIYLLALKTEDKLKRLLN